MLKLFNRKRREGKAAGPGRILCILKDSLFYQGIMH